MKLGIILALAAAMVIGIVIAASAQEGSCGPRVLVVEWLEGDHNEAFQGVTALDSWRALEVWSDEDRGTWTLILTTADGISCVIAAGNGWKRPSEGEGELH